MAFDAERCTEHERILRIDAAFRAGDLTALRAAVEDPDAVPNGPLPLEIGPCLEHHSGFPPLIAALSCSHSHPGSPGRDDVVDIVRLLLSFGADPHERGVNDYTALHMAVAERNLEAVEVLLQNGADPRIRTTIDDCETPRDMAEAAGLTDIARVLMAHEANREGQK